MIESIEPLLLQALAPLKDRFVGLTLRAGPCEARGAGPGPALTVWARDLRHTPRGEPERGSPRLGARLVARASADAHVWFVGAAPEQLAEVLGPEGRALIRGEDFTGEASDGGALLRLRAAPSGPPIAWIRGGPARGCQSRGPCEVRLVIVATAAGASEADELTRAALGLGLPTLAGLAPLEWTSFPAALPPGAGVRARVDDPLLTIRGQTRRWLAGEPARAVVTTKLRLCGELELEVAIGAPEPAGVIAEVVGQFGGAAIKLAAGAANARTGG